MTKTIISVENLKKSYRDHTVLDNLSFNVDRGTIFALLGENGAGKTTTVRILSTLITADRGNATISGHDTKRDAHTVRKKISLTGQYAAVDELLTGEENLQMMGRLNHLDQKTLTKRIADLLEQFDLVKAAKKPAKSYSGGMRRRLDIAISLLSTPEVLFLDEPTTGLDPRSRLTMWKFLQNLKNSGVTIFLTTQYLEEADILADKIAVIHQGKIVEEGTAEQLKRLVGEEMLELTFHDLKEFNLAQNLLNGLTDSSNLQIEVPSNGNTESLRQLLNELHDHSINPKDITFRKPTLDDVFMKITANSQKGEL
ncbi:ATP-binding cassette domain-containing protein [Ornithinibacillus salinisoli]|uniref:ATP-binding cassette domain-containing protein n=1 Tax=Ornithinibacillus salinisoli TaxID=1848459 RepID=A0ABW4VVU2_9BACI